MELLTLGWNPWSLVSLFKWRLCNIAIRIWEQRYVDLVFQFWLRNMKQGVKTSFIFHFLFKKWSEIIQSNPIKVRNENLPFFPIHPQLCGPVWSCCCTSRREVGWCRPSSWLSRGRRQRWLRLSAPRTL